MGAFTIVDEADGQGASRWGKLKSGSGWISMDYVLRGGKVNRISVWNRELFLCIQRGHHPDCPYQSAG